MQTFNLRYFITYLILIKLLALLVFCFFVTSCQKKEIKQILIDGNKVVISDNAVNLNTASLTDLEKLPGIGAKSAQNIIDHRGKYGRFRRPEHLLLVPGISDARFRQMRSLVKVE